jgi:hypothetical protein
MSSAGHFPKGLCYGAATCALPTKGQFHINAFQNLMLFNIECFSTSDAFPDGRYSRE